MGLSFHFTVKWQLKAGMARRREINCKNSAETDKTAQGFPSELPVFGYKCFLDCKLRREEYEFVTESNSLSRVLDFVGSNLSHFFVVQGCFVLMTLVFLHPNNGLEPIPQTRSLLCSGAAPQPPVNVSEWKTAWMHQLCLHTLCIWGRNVCL